MAKEKFFYDNTDEMPENYSNTTKTTDDQKELLIGALVVHGIDDKWCPTPEEVKTIQEIEKKKQQKQ